MAYNFMTGQFTQPQKPFYSFQQGLNPAYNFSAPAVQGIATQTKPAQTFSYPQQQTNVVPQQDNQQLTNPTNTYRQDTMNAINSGWDSYVNQLNDMLNVGLPGQRTALEGIAQSSYDQSLNTISSQKTQGETAVKDYQVRSLKDLAENARNLFVAGNNYLGARGAADSSATNQYSYALQKMNTKARGDILNTSNSRLNQINDIYNSEFNRLDSEKNQKINQIAQWFNEAQNSVRSQIGQAGLGRSQDLQALSNNIYNQAIQAVQNASQMAANQRAVLEQWATYNSSNIQQLSQNMKAISQIPQFQGIQGGMPTVTSEGGYYLPIGYGGYSNKRDMFGNPVY